MARAEPTVTRTVRQKLCAAYCASLAHRRRVARPAQTWSVGTARIIARPDGVPEVLLELPGLGGSGRFVELPLKPARAAELGRALIEAARWASSNGLPGG